MVCDFQTSMSSLKVVQPRFLQAGATRYGL